MPVDGTAVARVFTLTCFHARADDLVCSSSAECRPPRVARAPAAAPSRDHLLFKRREPTNAKKSTKRRARARASRRRLLETERPRILPKLRSRRRRRSRRARRPPPSSVEARAGRSSCSRESALSTELVCRSLLSVSCEAGTAVSCSFHMQKVGLEWLNSPLRASRSCIV